MRLWLGEVWGSLRPRHKVHYGVLWATLSVTVAGVVTAGFTLKSGFGLWVDLAFVFAAAGIGLPLVVMGVALGLTLLRKIPRLAAGVLLAAFVLLAMPWRTPWGWLLGAVLLAIECVLGASIANAASRRKRVAMLSLVALAIATNTGLLIFLWSDGLGPQSLRAPVDANLPAKLCAPDPSMPGGFAVGTMSYKHGSVDTSAFFPDFGGWKARLRKRYWGFGMDRLPLNGLVWYPRGAGPFPLVLMVHGNHEMSVPSDAGYGYLGELLASRGFVFVSIDENFLNTGLFHELPAEQPVRAWLMLEHLKLWRHWNETQGHPLYGKIDVANVALMGHSRGGEAAATAALINKLTYDTDNAAIRFDYGYPIKAVVAIAPADGQYKPGGAPRVLQDLNYLTLQGAQDADVSSFQGSGQWDRIGFSGKGDFFKSELYIYGANHVQFNTAWGRKDASGPKGWFLNLRRLLSGEQQRRIAQVYVTAFLEATLHGRTEYRQLFHDHRQARDWLPETRYIDRYLDSSNTVIAGFGEDADLRTTTLPGGKLEGQNLTDWHEGRIPFRTGDRGSNGVFLSWTSKAASYSLTLPPGLAQADSILTLSVAVTSETEDARLTDFTIALKSTDGVEVRLPVSRFRSLITAMPIHFTKFSFLDRALYQDASEPIFQGVEIPLETFAEQDKRFDPNKLANLRLIFDRTPASELIINQIGLTKAHLRE